MITKKIPSASRRRRLPAIAFSAEILPILGSCREHGIGTFCEAGRKQGIWWQRSSGASSACVQVGIDDSPVQRQLHPRSHPLHKMEIFK
jgi:hypothetical protein